MERIITSAYLAVITLVSTLAAVAVVGWALNIVALIQCDFKKPIKEEVLRCMGVAVPLVGLAYSY